MSKKHRKQQLPEVTVDSPTVAAVVKEAEAIAEEAESKEPKVTELKPGEGMGAPVALRQRVELEYECESCGSKFLSHRARQGEKFCVVCVELRRALKGFLKRGLSEDQILERSQKLLAK